MMRNKAFLLLILLTGTKAGAQTPIVQSDLAVPTKVAPAYFGPNAFPVPVIPEARIDKAITAELSGDFFLGQGKALDFTGGPSFRLRIPLWTDRAALSLWMPIQEWWRYDGQTAAIRRLGERYRDGGKGHDSGDLYISADLYVLKARGWIPDVLVRAVLKTASGNHFAEARYYDAPGYFFDATIANSLYFKGFFKELRGAASGGFLCWQTDNGRQNDAIQAGVSAMLDTKVFRLETQVAGYFGWEKDGDRPITARARLDFHAGHLSPFLVFAWGIRDYPFMMMSAGLRYDFPMTRFF